MSSHYPLYDGHNKRAGNGRKAARWRKIRRKTDEGIRLELLRGWVFRRGWR